MVPSGTMKASPQGGCIQVNSSSESLGSGSEMDGVNRSLPSTSGEQSGTIAIGCTFGVFWTALANNSKEGFLYLVLGLFLGGLQLFHCQPR